MFSLRIGALLCIGEETREPVLEIVACSVKMKRETLQCVTRGLRECQASESVVLGCCSDASSVQNQASPIHDPIHPRRFKSFGVVYSKRR